MSVEVIEGHKKRVRSSIKEQGIKRRSKVDIDGEEWKYKKNNNFGVVASSSEGKIKRRNYLIHYSAIGSITKI